MSELLLALVKNVAMWKEARGDRGNIHSPSVAEECRGERGVGGVRSEEREGKGREGREQRETSILPLLRGERGKKSAPDI